MSSLRYFLIYKPFGMLSQFTREGSRPVLGELHDFPKDVYPVGRLDADSEGLLILTNDTSVNAALLDPEKGHERTYYVQVEGDITDEALNKLCRGVEIRVKKALHLTLPANARKIAIPEFLPDRNPPVRFRANIPTSWLSLGLSEGKNRQVRRMTSAVGFPTLRLVRYGIGNLNLHDLNGPVTEIDRETFYKRLGL